MTADNTPRITAFATPNPPAASPESVASRFPLSPIDRNLPMIVSASMPIPLSAKDKDRSAASQATAKYPSSGFSFRARIAALTASTELCKASRVANHARSPDLYTALVK